MAIAVKKITLWRKEVVNDPGVLAGVLEPLSAAGANLRVVMGYTIPGATTRAAIEVFPIDGAKVTAAATAAKLDESPIACVLVEGDDSTGLGARMARAIAEESIDISFVMAGTVGSKFSAVFGFHSDADADTAATMLQAIKVPATNPATVPGTVHGKKPAKTRVSVKKR